MKPSSTDRNPKRPGSRVKSYIDALPAEAREHMQTLRKVIGAAAPVAVESFGYGMPAFSLYGKPLVWYGAWKGHSSFYPLSGKSRSAFAAELKGYRTPGRGTIQFPFDKPVPVALVRRLVHARIAEFRKKQR
jgi:uncharacterized protein YdhG (YjbR/CyaY superfamily)